MKYQIKYKKKPVVVEALKLNHKNLDKIWNWMGDSYVSHGECGDDVFLWLEIKTLEGTMTAKQGDWIIKGIKGEFYPCKPDIFQATYEKVEE